MTQGAVLDGPDPSGTAASGGLSIARHAIGNAEAYTEAVTGTHVEAVQLRRGVDTSTIHTAVEKRFVATSGSARIPIATYSTIPDDVLVIGHIADAPPGSSWCGIDLTPGLVLVYEPGAEHAGVDEPGLEFTFVAARVDAVRELADELQISLLRQGRGSVRAIERHPSVNTVTRAFGALTTRMRNGVSDNAGVGDDVLYAMVDVITSPDHAARIVDGSSANSLSIVRACMDYVESVRRLPSMGELCLVAGVSERRLRLAFNHEFDASPAQFFRRWALDQAHRRLLVAVPDERSVSWIATDLGFNHLGRFSRYYRQVYGVPPSATLRSATR